MTSFSVLSWNIALGGPSIQAPSSVDNESNLFSILDLIEYHDPDFICLQEMPNQAFGNYFSNEYVSGTPVQSHSGYTNVFVRKGPIANLPIQLESQLNLTPVSGITLTVGDNFLIVFSIHLPPTKDNADYRFAFLKNLVSQLSPLQPLVLAGDTNMREAETTGLSKIGLNDAYKEIEDLDRKNYATWDSFENPYHSNSFAFKARFDRTLYRNLQIDSFELIGNSPVNDPPYYLSDHFGTLTKFEFLK